MAKQRYYLGFLVAILLFLALVFFGITLALGKVKGNRGTSR